jgi:hypothetical protein
MESIIFWVMMHFRTNWPHISGESTLHSDINRPQHEGQFKDTYTRSSSVTFSACREMMQCAMTWKLRGPLIQQFSNCRILGFNGVDYEEFSLMGYKSPVRTSQETYYIYATEPSRLMLCKICGYHSGD